MVRTRECLGEAGVRLPWTGNLTRHFVFQSSFSKNKKKASADSRHKPETAHTCTYTLHISHTRKHISVSSPFISTHHPSVFLFITFHTSVLKELHLPLMVPFGVQNSLTHGRHMVGFWSVPFSL